MKQFFVEVFTARANAGKLAGAERRATVVAQRVSGASREVRFVRAMYLPDDEICFFVFDAACGGDAALAARRAGLEPIRVVEAVSSTKEER